MQNYKRYSDDLSLIRYGLLLEYNGKYFAGSQKQPNQRTIQDELERALKILLKFDVKTIFSGRTDKGVHSKGQIVHFDSFNNINLDWLTYSLNSILPDDISVVEIKEFDRMFHSQKSAKFRWYRYSINNSANRSVWLNETLLLRKHLDENAINQALAYLVGEHDFNSFKGSNSSNPARVCKMYKADCSRNGNIINIDLVANRFLYNMVRVIIGTIIPVGSGVSPPESVKEILEQNDRRFAGPTVSPDGLTLMYVGYEDKYNTLNLLNKEAINYENLLCKAS